MAGLSGVCARCGCSITAAMTAAGSGGIRDGVVGVWWWLGGYLEAAGHGQGGGLGLFLCY